MNIKATPNGNGVNIHVEFGDSAPPAASTVPSACGCYRGISTRYGMDNPIMREVVSTLTIRFLPFAMVTIALLVLILGTLWAA